MQIKRYVAGSLQDGMRAIRQELGENAIILNTKTIYPTKWLSWFMKPKVEVIAAVDEKTQSMKEHVSPDRNHDEVKATPRAAAANESSELKQEIKELKELVIRSYIQNRVDLPDVLVRLRDDLIEKGVEERLVSDWLHHALTHEEADLNNRLWLADLLNEHYQDKPFQVIDGSKSLIIFAGPTGVGKTTTIAKIAADLSLRHKKKVGLITADTFRIAAVEQLKTYAQILNLPLEVVYSPKEVLEAQKKLSGCELILMDTAGRNLFAPLQRSELFAYIPQGNNVETHLVLSMTMNYADMRRLVESFQGQQTFKLLFTKLDESSKIGHIFNLIHHFSHPVSYLSTGQNVPDDLQQAELKGLIQALLRGNP